MSYFQASSRVGRQEAAQRRGSPAPEGLPQWEAGTARAAALPPSAEPGHDGAK